MGGKHEWNAASVSAFTAVLFSWFASGIERGEKKVAAVMEKDALQASSFISQCRWCQLGLASRSSPGTWGRCCHLLLGLFCCWLEFFCSRHWDVNCGLAQSAFWLWLGKPALNHLSSFPCPGCIWGWSTSQRYPWSAQRICVGRTVLQTFPLPPKVSKPGRTRVAPWNF